MSRRPIDRFTTPLAATLLALAATVASAAGGPDTGREVRFLTGPQPGDALAIAETYVRGHLQELGLDALDLEDMVVSDRYVTRHNGTTHVYFQQRLGGVEVVNGLINVNVARDGSVINLGNRFVGDLAQKANATAPQLGDRDAIARAAAHFGRTPSDLLALRTEGGDDQRAVFADASLSDSEIPVRLVYQPLEDGSVRLAWQTNLDLVGSPDWWNVSVDAITGEVLWKYNWTSYDSYQAIPFPPYSDPEDSGGQAVIADPADAAASPFGWHDTNGVVGAEFTVTRGNNVSAQDDLDANNSGGLQPSGGATLDFLYTWNPAQQPTEGTNLEAAIVNLFYVNNVMHDLTYHYGFDEAAGNFQANNYGNGGSQNDPVQADALDGSGTGNANFSTPPDGSSGRMQMFRWIDSGPLVNGRVTENSPTARDFVAARGTWGGDLAPAPTANVQIVNGGGAIPSEGCNALTGFTPGNIALIDRGSCEFGLKALNAQNAGAIAAIIVNNQNLPNGIIAMGAGASGGSVTIPAVMIGNADGQLIKNELALPATVNLTVQCPSGGCPVPNPIDRDSDFDNGVIAHEYGHGISNRLTGGPSNTSCLFGSEQAGEGWSDFWTLMLTAKPSETATTTKSVGNYVSFLPPTGAGIRNFPYSTDLGVNPQTYVNIGATNVPHGVGEIWMAMVWEVYWELVTKHGFDGDFYDGTGGNNLTIQLVVDGMKLQGCGPTFVSARNAILLADQNNNGGANQCEIWRGFAKRGLGFSATAGTTNVGDETQAFDLPVGCSATPSAIFTDKFESGGTLRWSNTVSAP